MTDALAGKAVNPKAVLTGSAPLADETEGMSYLHSLPRRLVTVYLPLSVILFVLLFPFYWMALTSIKPDEQLLDLDTYSPFWTWNPTLKHITKPLFETEYPIWLWNTMLVAVCATALSIIASVLAAYAIVRLRYKGAQWVGGAIFLPTSAAVDPVHSAVDCRFPVRIVRHAFALILTSSDDPYSVPTWLLMGYFKTILFELEECALIDGASRWQISDTHRAAVVDTGVDSAFIFCFTLCWNEFIYALTFISSTQYKTVPVAIVTALVDGDIYRWAR
jgi:multiple sugar transport system permease protein